MDKREEWRRERAIERHLRGEKARAIWVSLGRTERWLYKWLERYREGEPEWYRDRSRKPIQTPSRTSKEIEKIVKYIRLELYNRDEFCGAQAIRWRLEDENVQPLPGLRTIGRILARHGLTHRRTGRYEPKGKRYPALDAPHPGSVHESDFAGPCYLRGPLRFYSLNTIDLATGRCGAEPVLGGKDTVTEALWATWLRLGLRLKRESLAFEQRHNQHYRYSKLHGKTPLEALAAANKPLRFPVREQPPKPPLPKPQTGCYHVVRFIRSDALFNLFGETFSMPPEVVYEYVWATVDVARQRLTLSLDDDIFHEQEYLLR